MGNTKNTKNVSDTVSVQKSDGNAKETTKKRLPMTAIFGAIMLSLGFSLGVAFTHTSSKSVPEGTTPLVASSSPNTSETPGVSEAVIACGMSSKEGVYMPGAIGDSAVEIFYRTSEYPEHEVTVEDVSCFLKQIGATDDDLKVLGKATKSSATSIVVPGYQIRNRGDGIILVFAEK